MNVDEAMEFADHEYKYYASDPPKAEAAAVALTAEVRLLREASADAMRRLERAHDDADKYQLRALAAETKLARVEALVPRWRMHAASVEAPGRMKAAFELEAALKGAE